MRWLRRLFRRRGYGPWRPFTAKVKISGTAISMSAFDHALKEAYAPALRAALAMPSPFGHMVQHSKFQIAPGAWHYTADLGQKELPAIDWDAYEAWDADDVEDY